MKTKRKNFKTWNERTARFRKEKLQRYKNKARKEGERFSCPYVWPENGFSGWVDFQFVAGKSLYFVTIETAAHLYESSCFCKATDIVEKKYEVYTGEKYVNSLFNFNSHEPVYNKSGHIIGYKVLDKKPNREEEFSQNFYGVNSVVKCWQVETIEQIKNSLDEEIEIGDFTVEEGEYCTKSINATLNVEYITKDVINQFIEDFITGKEFGKVKVKVRNLRGIENYMVNPFKSVNAVS